MATRRSVPAQREAGVGAGRPTAAGALADREGQPRRAEGQQAGGGERHPVVAEPDAKDTGLIGREGGADLMPEEDPAEEDGAGAFPEALRGQAGGRRHGGDPVEAADHAKERQRRQVISVRQEEQRDAPQPVIPR